MNHICSLNLIPRNNHKKQRDVSKSPGRNKILDEFLVLTVLCHDGALGLFGQVLMDSDSTLLEWEGTPQKAPHPPSVSDQDLQG